MACSSSSDGTNASDENTSGVNPVVQIPFQTDPNTTAFLGTLTGDAELTNAYTQHAYDPDGGDLASYAWDFGDGSSADTADPSHTYAESGAYEVTLTVTDDEGNSCDAMMTNVVVSEEDDPPAVRIHAHSLSTITGFGFGITFNAIAVDPEGDDLTYLWDFGDGSSSTEKTPGHVYEAAGAYQPSVTVTDAGDNSSSAHVCVIVFPNEEEEDGAGPDEYFDISCDPNPGEFFHGDDTTIDLLQPIGPGIPDSWYINSGLDGAPLDSDPWTGSDSFAIPAEEDSPTRLEYFSVQISASNLTHAETEFCESYVFHSESGGSGPPPEVDIGDEENSRVVYSVNVTALTGEIMDVSLRITDADDIPKMGRITLILGDSQGDPDASFDTATLDEVGRADLQVEMNKLSGSTSLIGIFNETEFTITTITVE